MSLCLLIPFYPFCFQPTATKPPSDIDKKVDQNLKLDEILDICADFEKQIQAEQEELRLLAQKKIEEQEMQQNTAQFQTLHTSQSHNNEHNSIQFGAISFFPSTPPLPAKRGTSPLKSPTASGVNAHQWSPLNTLSPNR